MCNKGQCWVHKWNWSSHWLCFFLQKIVGDDIFFSYFEATPLNPMGIASYSIQEWNKNIISASLQDSLLLRRSKYEKKLSMFWKWDCCFEVGLHATNGSHPFNGVLVPLVELTTWINHEKGDFGTQIESPSPKKDSIIGKHACFINTKLCISQPCEPKRGRTTWNHLPNLTWN